MKVTKALRAWATEKLGLAADASEQELKAAVGKALAEDRLTASDFAKLQLGDAPARKSAAAVDSDALASLIDKSVAKAMADRAAEERQATEASAVEKIVNEAVEKAIAGTKVATANHAADETKFEPSKAFFAAGSGGNQRIEVKKAFDCYDQTKAPAWKQTKSASGEFRNTETPLHFEGRRMYHHSDAEKALAAAWFKYQVHQSTKGSPPCRGLKMTDHDWDLVKYAMHELPFSGRIGLVGEDNSNWYAKGQKLTDVQIKALIDDSTSGGTEAVPLVYDDAVVMTPLLYGELFPLVDVVDVPTGRLVNAVGFANPTFTSNTAEGSAVSLYTTTGFVSGIDTTIFNATICFEIGNDFAEDSMVNAGQVITQAIGNAAATWLDEQIAIGDGSTEPEGIFVAGGTTSVSSGTGSSGPLDVGDAEALMFGVPKEYRQYGGGRSCAFVACETTYKRFRAIPVSAQDQRRVFGMDHGSFSLLEYPFKIQQDISQAKVAFCNLAYYRMYRRRGLSVRVETGGQQLAQKNTSLLVARMRYGGKLTKSAACAVMSDAPLH